MGRSKSKLSSAAHFFSKIILDFIYPPFCILCNNSLSADEETFCQKCWQNQQRIKESFLPASKMPYIPGPKIYLDGSVACFEYSEVTQEFIHTFKYRKLDRFSFAFGAELATVLKEFYKYPQIDAIVPVPLHKQRLKERGFNQSQLLAQAIADNTKIDLLDNVLFRSRYTKPQAKMNRQERIKNVQGAFELAGNSVLTDKIIVLVDDVLTTGSTMNECARVLKQGGAKAVFCLTLSRI